MSQICRKVHKLSHDGPSDTLKRKVAEMEKKKRSKDPKRHRLYVDVPESTKWLDVPTMPMILISVGTAIFAKILMMVSSFFYFIVLESINNKCDHITIFDKGCLSWHIYKMLHEKPRHVLKNDISKFLILMAVGLFTSHFLC